MANHTSEINNQVALINQVVATMYPRYQRLSDLCQALGYSRSQVVSLEPQLFSQFIATIYHYLIQNNTQQIVQDLRNQSRELGASISTAYSLKNDKGGTKSLAQEKRDVKRAHEPGGVEDRSARLAQDMINQKAALETTLKTELTKVGLAEDLK